MSNSAANKEVELPADDAWKTVCIVDDLVKDSGVCVLFEYKQVALFYIGDPATIYAIANFDPFSKANVLSRGIVGSIQGQVVVASPIFKQHFSLLTGACLEDESISVDVYSARIEGKHVQLKRSQQ